MQMYFPLKPEKSLKWNVLKIHGRDVSDALKNKKHT